MVILVNRYAIKHYNTIQQTTLQIFLTMHLVNRGQFLRIFGQILVNLYDIPHYTRFLFSATRLHDSIISLSFSCSNPLPFCKLDFHHLVHRGRGVQIYLDCSKISLLGFRLSIPCPFTFLMPIAITCCYNVVGCDNTYSCLG